jgi:hypothetical protein
VLLFIDGLDESLLEVGSRVRDFLYDVLPDNVSMLFTSRDLPDIGKTFEKDEHIEISAHDKDISTFVASCLEGNDRLASLVRKPPSMEDEFCADVIAKAKGM